MGTAVNFATENFWVVLLIMAMLIMKEHRLGGLILLAVQALWGTVVWAFTIVVIISVLWELARWSTYGGMIHRGDLHNEWVPQDPQVRKNGGPRKKPRAPREERKDPDFE